MKAIATQEIWDHVTNQTIPEGQEFELSEDRVQSLIGVGAAKLVGEESVPGDTTKQPAPPQQQGTPQVQPTPVPQPQSPAK